MRKQRHDPALAAACPMEIALDYMGGKWKGVILFRLAGGPVRFAALQRLLCRITPRTLTQALREMEADGLVIRTVFPAVPPQVDYRLTQAGLALLPALTLLKDWSESYAKGVAAPHATPASHTPTAGARPTAAKEHSAP
jgi:DNA-binding HxlR family transcriptional regulator